MVNPVSANSTNYCIDHSQSNPVVRSSPGHNRLLVCHLALNSNPDIFIENMNTQKGSKNLVEERYGHDEGLIKASDACCLLKD